MVHVQVAVKITIVIFIITVILCFIPAVADPEIKEMQRFASVINHAWTNRDYSAIISNINERLAVKSNDVFALCVKSEYFVWCDNNPAGAHDAVNRMSNTVFESPRYELRPLLKALTELTLAIPLDDTNQYSQLQIDNNHELFPEYFPGIIDCFSFAYNFTSSRDIQITSQNPSDCIPVTPSGWDANALREGTTCFSRVYLKGQEMSFSVPLIYSNYTFVEWLRDGLPYSTNLTVSFTVDSYETWTVVYTNAP